MAIVKSKLLKQLAKNYPNFLKKDLEKFTNIILNEIKFALKRGDRVEIRGFGSFSKKTIRPRKYINPKTKEESYLGETSIMHFKASKKLQNAHD